MAVDWKDVTAEHVVTFQMVSQTNLGDTWGELEGVDLSGSSLDAGYYTDERTSGTLAVVGEHWRRGSFIRVIHEIPKYGYKATLGTYIVTSDDAKCENGVWHYELELHSMLRTLVSDLLTRPWAIPKGSSATTAMKEVLTSSGVHSMRKTLGDFSDTSGATVEVDTSLAEDVQAKTAQMMKAGKSRLECLFALADMGGNRVDVVPYGYIRIEKRVSPASKVPKFRIDLADPRGIAIEGTLSRSTDWLSMPDTVVVQHDYTDEVETGETYKSSGTRSDGTTYNKGDPKTKNEQKTVYGTAKVASTSHQSVGVRGYSIVDFQSVKDLTPHTAKRAAEKAQEILKRQSVELVEWELETTYIPVWEGDVVELVVHDGLKAYQGVRKCLVKDVTISLDTMRMQLTLKETAAGDKGDVDE